jgi:hypothetical protein
MRDPRIDRLLLRIDETTANGIPARVAEIATQVNGILVEVEKLRSEIDVANRQVTALAAREAALKKALAARSGRAAGAAVSGSNALALNSMTQFTLADEPDLEFQQERLEMVTANLQARRQFVQRTEALLATRMATVEKLLDLFTRIEEGTTVRRHRRRRVRRVRRR